MGGDAVAAPGTLPICMPNRHWTTGSESSMPRRRGTPASVESDTFAMTALQRAYWVGRGADQPLGGVGCQTYFELVGASVDPVQAGGCACRAGPSTPNAAQYVSGRRADASLRPIRSTPRCRSTI